LPDKRANLDLCPRYFLLFRKRYHMGARVKPVQPTEIKDKRIIWEAIEQIRRKPTATALKRHKEQEEALMRLLKK
jgi:hypothetical protein